MDFRAYLQAIGSPALEYTGNDGKIDPTKAGYDTPYQSYLNTPETQSAVQGYVDNLWNTYNDNGGALGAVTTEGNVPTGARTVSAPSTDYYGRGGTGRNAQGYTYDEQLQADQAAFEAQSTVDQANQYLGKLDEQANIYNQNLDSTYANYRAGLENQYGRNQQDYNRNLVSTAQDSERERWNADRNVGQKYGALQRFFGMAGAGGSLAATQYAPQLLSQIGNQNRSQIQGAYDKNVDDLNLNWNRYGTDFNNSILEMEDQKEAARRAKQLEVEQTRQDLRDRVSRGQQAIDFAKTGNLQGSRNIQAQANNSLGSYLDKITALGKQRITPQARDVAYSNPSLQAYQSYNPALQANQVNPTGTLDYYTYITNKAEKDKNNIGY